MRDGRALAIRNDANTSTEIAKVSPDHSTERTVRTRVRSLDVALARRVDCRVGYSPSMLEI